MHTQSAVRVLVFLGLLLKVLVPGIIGVEYGPSLSSLTGVFVNWKGPDLFSLESGRRVKLENYPGYAAVIPLITGDSKATSEQIFKERGISTVGEFIVEAPKGYGIIAVIQEMKLRKTTRDRGNSNTNINATISCSDYVQFGEKKSEANRGFSPKICGTVNRDDTSTKPEGLLGPRSFRSPSNKMLTAFNHAYVAELVDSLLGSRQKHVLKLEIAYTAYKENCTDESAVSNTTTPLTIEDDGYQMCSEYTSSDKQICISSQLLCDDIYNCGSESDILGSDEDTVSCPDKPIRTTPEPSKDEKDSEEKAGETSFPNFATYFGIPSLSTYQPTRKFRPYVSSSGYSFDFTTRRPDRYITTISSSSASSTEGSSSDNNKVESEKPSVEGSEVPSSNVNSDNNLLKYGEEEDYYNRRQLSHAINSVIYGVAIFIIFTIFITVFVVCVAKKIQMTWVERRNSSSAGSQGSHSTSVSTPSIIPSTTATVFTSGHVPGCIIPPPNGDLAYPSNPNTTVVVLTLPQETYDPPPSYDTLFPAPEDTTACPSP